MTASDRRLVAAALLLHAVFVFLFEPIAGFLIPLIGVVLFAWSTFHKIGRTGAFITWELRRLESTAFEKRLKWSGFVLAAGGIAVSWFFRAIAQGV